MQYIISYQSQSFCVQLQDPSSELLHQHITQRLGIPLQEQRLVWNGKEITEGSLPVDKDFVPINLHLRLLAGKGGFGSLLRSSKSTKKTTNFGACRTADGQRLRDVQAQQRLAEAHQQAEAEANREKPKPVNKKAEEYQAKIAAQEEQIQKEEKIRKEIIINLEASVQEGIILVAQKKKEQREQKKRKHEETVELPDDMWGDLLDDEEEVSDEEDKEPNTKKQKHAEAIETPATVLETPGIETN